MAPLLGFIGITLGIVLAIIIAIYIIAPAFRGVSWLVRHIFAFISGMIGSLLRVIGGVLATIVFVPLVLLNIIIGRWSAAAHFGRGVQDEIRSVGTNLYRFFIGHPARFLLLSPLVEGIERRVPQAVAHAPTKDKPSKRTGQFEGYEIVGSLRGGGSGGRLYIAKPDEKKRAQFARRGVDADTVVIKVFSLADGSSLPQIVRESRALDAAKKLGLVLEHELTDKRFYYVMRYVPGDTLSIVTQRLHDKSGPVGLRPSELRDAIAYSCDLAASLDQYHRGGLWHKDVKPDNIIVHDGRAELVDFGLVTPLRSAMTLTTHGTEYFRDPEMVRLALKGVKVHEVNGAKFDIYAAGAVLYSLLEGSFPAHGVLSQVTKKSPDALKWIIRRAMADYDNRYDTIGAMLADLRVVRDAADPFSIRVADLPSMRAPGAPAPDDMAFARPASYTPEDEFAHAPRAASPVPPRNDAPFNEPPRPAQDGARPVVVDWWTGKFRVDRAEQDKPFAPFERAARKAEEFLGFSRPAAQRAESPFAASARAARGSRDTAAEQLRRARERVRAAQDRANKRMNPNRATRVYGAQINSGVAIALLIFLGGCVFLASIIIVSATRSDRARAQSVNAGGVEVHTVTPDMFSDFDPDTVREWARSFANIRTSMENENATMRDQIAAYTRHFTEIARVAADEARAARAEIDAASPVSPPSPRAPLALPSGAKVVVGGNRGVSINIDASASAPATPNAASRPISPALLGAGAWVVIDDAAPEGVSRDKANALLASLRAAGLPLIADDANATLETLEVIASARAAAGIALADDRSSSSRLLRWLAERQGDPIGVLRIGRADDPDQLLTVVLTWATPLGDLMRDAIQDADAGRLAAAAPAAPPRAPPAPAAPARRDRR
ncbi:MAG: hypothetical protein KF684_11195 [Phycisphaeraceae bacterium]|nr:hypothetical protein [Phycisphaeraceae bacterium]